MTAISADRLLALLLGLRYRQIVTVKCIHVISVFFWIASGVFALCQSLIYHIKCWYGFVVTAFCLMISSASYTKIFRALSRHQTQIQSHAQQHPSQPNALNIARYRKAVHSALWVQLALFVCYLPYCIVVIFTAFSKISQTHLAVSGTLTLILVSFNSTLNPFLYCWKISEERQAVKQTMRLFRLDLIHMKLGTEITVSREWTSISSDKNNKDLKRFCTGYHCMVSEDNITDLLTSDENPIDRPLSLGSL